MTHTPDFISELFAAANTIHDIAPLERRRLIERGIATVRAQRELLHMNGNTVSLEPGFMKDMPGLAVMAARDEGIEVLVAAGMLMLAAEIRRLRILRLGCER